MRNPSTARAVRPRIIAQSNGLPTPKGLWASGHDSRIDLTWEAPKSDGVVGYNIYRADSADGDFKKINDKPHLARVYSDFFGENGQTYYYHVSNLFRDRNGLMQESLFSYMSHATSKGMSDDELLTSVQEATIRYFYEFAHPVSGLVRERSEPTPGLECAMGGTGFGLLNIVVGVERGFIGRDAAAEHVLKVLTFLDDKCDRYHGAFSHWVDGETGKTIPFSDYDDGADLVETALLMQGVLVARQFFTADGIVEAELRRRATALWEAVEWDWFRKGEDGDVLYWHWSPEHAWKMDMPIRGFNECMIVYLLAIASPTHPVPASLYYSGWAGHASYANGEDYYGYRQWVGPALGGPLFFTQYSFIAFDPRGKRDKFCNYFENNRNIALIQRTYCKSNASKFKGYSSRVWGLTACYAPRGYHAHAAGDEDRGTVAPTAAISAMPYTPEASMETLRHLYHAYGHRIWGEFGFRDAFNLDKAWFAKGYIAIDQGTIAPMIENHRSGLCWNLFMSNPEIQPMLDAIGWTADEQVIV